MLPNVAFVLENTARNIKEHIGFIVDDDIVVVDFFDGPLTELTKL